MSKPSDVQPLDEQLIRVLRSLDNQIARELQRSPSEKEVHGVTKWEPYQKRVERLVGATLDALGAQEVTLDGVLVLSQAMAKALGMIIDDLKEEGLGKVRAEYCRAAIDHIKRDAGNAEQILRPVADLN